MHLVPRLDHIMTAVADLDRAAEAYRRLGFTLTERGQHLGQGTHNRLAMLEGDYLELIGVETPTERNASLRKRLAAGHEGISALALACNDEEAAARHLADIGLGAGPPVRVTRPVRLPQGARDAEFGIVKMAEGAVPGASMFFCRHYTPDIVWRPEWQAHPNGARRIRAVTATHPDPAACASRFVRLLGESTVRASEGGLTVALGSTPLLVLDPDAAADWSAGLAERPTEPDGAAIGFTIEVASIDKLRGLLAASGIHTKESEGRILVPPSAACGAVIAFTDST
jgi:catechol 2,3-dioxygenase-like lactoylglutathione lyase family enzyme